MEEHVIANYYNTLVEVCAAAYLSQPIGKYPPKLAAIENPDEKSYQAARRLGRSSSEIDPWDDSSLPAARDNSLEVYRPRGFKLVGSSASFLRPMYSHAFYRREIRNPTTTAISPQATERIGLTNP